MDRDRIIRIVLEGRDRLSGALRSAMSSVDNAANRMQRSFNRARKESEALEDTTTKAFDSIDKGSKKLDGARRRMEGLSKQANTLRRDLRILTDDTLQRAGNSVVRKGAGGRFERVEPPTPIREQALGALRQFREGRDIARETEKRLREAIPQTKEEFAAAKARIKEENRLREENRKQQEAADRELLRQSIARREAAVQDEARTLKDAEKERARIRSKATEDEIQKLKDADADRHAQNQKDLAEEIANRKEQYQEERAQRRIDADQEIDQLRLKREDASTRAAKKAITQEIRGVEDALKAKERAERRIRDAEIRDLRNADSDRERKKKQELRARIDEEKRAMDAINADAQKAADRAADARVQGVQEESRQRRITFAQDVRKQKQEVSAANAGALAALAAPDEPSIIRDFLRDRQGIDAGLKGLQRSARDAGLAWGDFFRGLRRGRGDLRELSGAIREADNRAARFGQRVGQISRSLGTLVNLRWFILISAIQLFGSAIVVIGSNLISLASSASLAAAAIGGALANAFAQAAPVAALFAATMSRVGKVMDATQKADQVRLTRKQDQEDTQDARIQAAQRLADASWSLKLAIEAVGNAEYDLAKAHTEVSDAEKDRLDAVQRLAEARRNAAKDIVDANFEERDAALSLEEAELAVLEAKRRLRELEEGQRGSGNIDEAKAAVREARARLAIAQSQNDQAEIEKASHQLTLAQQNLDALNTSAEESKNQLQEAQTAVKRAELTREQAQVRNARARQEAQQARREGIEGNEEVINARRALVDSTKAIADAQRGVILQQRQLRDAVHGVTVARREEKDAQNALGEAQQKQTAAQKNLQDQLADLSPAERGLFKAFRNIQDTYRKQFRPITDIIIRSITFAVNTAAKLLEDPRILNAFTTLAQAIADGIVQLTKFFGSDSFIEKFTEFTKQAASNIPEIVNIIQNLITAFLNLATAGAPIFESLLAKIVGVTQKLASLTSDEDRMNKFFANAGEHLNDWLQLGVAIGRILRYLIAPASGPGKGVLNDITEFFNHIADWLRDNPERTTKFFETMREHLRALAILAGRVGIVLFETFTSKEAQAFTELIVQVVIPGLTLMLQLVGLLSRLLLFLFGAPIIGEALKFIATVIVAEKALNRIFPVTQKITDAFKILVTKGYGAFKVALATTFPLLAKLVSFIRTTLIPTIITLGRALFTTPLGWIILGIAAVVTAIILLDKKFHFIRPTIEFFGRQFRRIFNWLKDNWPKLLVILTGPFGLVVLAVIKWHDKIIGFFKSIINWVRDNWKTIAKVLLAVFLPGAALLVGIYTFRDKIIGVFKEIKDAIIGAFKEAFNWVRKELADLGSWIENKVRSIPIIGEFLAGKNELTDKDANEILGDPSLKRFGSKIKNLRTKGMTPQEIIATLIEDENITKEQFGRLVKKYAFAAGGEVPGGGEGMAVPIIAHAGEWVLNKGQIAKVSRQLGMGANQLKAWLFGTNAGEGKPGPKTTGTKPTSREEIFYGRQFNLVPHTDDNGNTVWFIEFDDGTFGQVTARDATRIKNTNGEWIPKYVQRNAHGFNPARISLNARSVVQRGIAPRYALGGVVSPHVQSFARGGIVTNASNKSSKTVNVPQNFNITTEGDSDWNWIMRMAAMRAQEAF